MYEISKTIFFIGNLIDPLKNPRNYFLLKTKRVGNQKCGNIFFLSHLKILNRSEE